MTDLKIGIVTGAFDVIHPGYIDLLEDAKKQCNYLVVALHDDPTLEHSQKLPVVLTVGERIKILLALRYVDIVIPYKTENDLIELLKRIKPHIRILGDDYKDKPITGQELAPIYYHARRTGWSTTKFKQACGRAAFQSSHENHSDR